MKNTTTLLAATALFAISTFTFAGEEIEADFFITGSDYHAELNQVIVSEIEEEADFYISGSEAIADDIQLEAIDEDGEADFYISGSEYIEDNLLRQAKARKKATEILANHF